MIGEYCNATQKSKLIMEKEEVDKVIAKRGHGRGYLCPSCGGYHLTFMEKLED